jgi:MFS transporter, DHA2 family, integral membrane protein
MPRERTSEAQRTVVLTVLCLSLLMVVVGNTVLNIALPTLVRELHATNTQLQWMVDAYSLVFAGLLLTSGAIGDRFGRKGVLQIGLALFGLASLAATVSNGPNQIIAARAVMGVAASLVMPSTLSILTNVFPQEERARAIAIWAGVAGAGAAIGPITAGYLLEHFWWGSIFFLNIPVVIVALGTGHFVVPKSRDERQRPLDPIGAALSIVATSTLVFAIIEAPTRGWSDIDIVAAFILAAAVFAVFAVWELRSAEPMLDLRFFKRHGFTGGALSITFVFFAMFGFFFLFTQYLQVVHGYSALGAGVRTLPMAAMMMVAAPMSARVVERVGTRNVVALGLTIVALSMLWFSRLGIHTPYWEIAIELAIVAVGMGFTMPPSTASIMSSLPLAKAGVGSAMNDTTRELGGALGVAVLGSVLASRYTGRLDHQLLTIMPEPVRKAAQSSVGAAVTIGKQIGGVNGQALIDSAKHAFVSGMGLAFIVATGAAIGAAAVAFRIMPRQLTYEPEFTVHRPLEESNGHAGEPELVTAAN